MTVGELHHEETGVDAHRTVLLGGSLGSTLAMWDPQVPALAAQARLIRFDHRGHGASPVLPGPDSIADLGRDVLGLLDRLAIERASYCGLSLGGMVGMWLAAHAPERIDHLVLISTAACPPSPSAYTERAAVVREAGTPDAVAALDLRAALPAIRASTLVIAGAEDLAIPPAHGRAIADAVPGARLHVLERAAHLASVEQDGAVTELIADHLDSREEP